MTDVGALPEQLLYLIIRFAASIPDLSLTISSPKTTTTLSLKQLIRQHLPHAHSTARLRLIYAGKVLADTTSLSASLRLPPPSPPRHNPHNDYGPGSKSKGKQPVRDGQVSDRLGTDWPEEEHNEQKYYIHCSLGDALSYSELAAEAAAAQASELTLRKQFESSVTSKSSHRRMSSGGTSTRPRGSSTTEPTPAPQGFDRLLSSGFTPQEVAALRTQFQANVSFTHTPDTMPSPTTLRAMEDRWLDSTATDPSVAALGGSAGEAADAGWGAGFTAEEGGLDDMLYGYFTGFFWALPAMIWGFREEGVWPRRRQLAVVMGVVLNVLFGFLRWGS